MVCKPKSKNYGKPRERLVDEEDEYAFAVERTADMGKVTVSVRIVPVEIVIDSGVNTNVVDKHHL